MLIFIGSIITFFKKLCGSLLNVRDCLHQCQFCCDVGLMLTSSRLHVTMKITKCLSLEFSLKIQGPKIFKGFLKMSYTYNQSQRLILRFCICAFYYTTHDIKSQNCSGRFNHCMYIYHMEANTGLLQSQTIRKHIISTIQRTLKIFQREFECIRELNIQLGRA